ncbi:hypothetical protein C2W58_02469 [Bacillus pumilus]|uniref:Uncharacterized protein n=1 Tax=Bacillus pumilus TaxID=1408 RepID=A0AB34QYX1_BACPU|nr:hypothetical protein B4127_2782 [Bacillus pumilus]RAP14368.1 hypothetical protein C2W58_02469 [Bacillus pumilus]
MEKSLPHSERMKLKKYIKKTTNKPSQIFKQFLIKKQLCNNIA